MSDRLSALRWTFLHDQGTHHSTGCVSGNGPVRKPVTANEGDHRAVGFGEQRPFPMMGSDLFAILETLPGNTEWVQTAATLLQLVGGDPDGFWAGWRSLVASVDDKVEEFNAQIERGASIAASVGVEP